MKKETEEKLQRTLRRLEKTTAEVLKTRGYSQDSRTLKILEEMIREQLGHENSRSTTRSVR